MTGTVDIIDLLEGKRWIWDYPRNWAEWGMRYHREGRVLQVQVTDAAEDFLQLSGLVNGARFEPYQVDICIERTSGKTLRIEGGCTCPVAAGCKHEVAVLLEASNRGMNEGIREQAASGHGSRARGGGRASGGVVLSADLNAWMDCVEELMGEGEGKRDPFALAESAGRRLVYLLTDEPEGPVNGAPIALKLVAASRLKSGEFSEKASTTPDLSQLLYTRPSYMSDGDVELIRKVRILSGAYSRTAEFAIAGSGWDAVLGEITATGRCHWKSVAGPRLAMGPAREARLSWGLDAGGRFRPVIETTPRSSATVGATPPIYLDLEKGEVGVALTDIPAAAAAAWLEGPAVEAGSIESVSKVLASRSPAIASGKLPSPSNVPVRVLENTEPGFLLRLARFDATESESPWSYITLRDLPAAELLADYGGHLTPCYRGAPEQVFVSSAGTEGEACVVIKRNARAEEEALKELRQAELQRITSFFPKSEIRPECQHLYLLETAPFSGTDIEESDASAWVQFLARQAPALEAKGIAIEIEKGFGVEVGIPDDDAWYTDLEPESADGESAADWFSLRFGLEFEGKEIDLIPLLVRMIEGGYLAAFEVESGWGGESGATIPLEVDEGKFLALPMEKLRLPMQLLSELCCANELTGGGELRVHRLQAAQIAAIDPSQTALRRTSKALLDLGKRLKSFRGLNKAPKPRGFKAKLRPYQLEGLAWLQFLREHGLGGVLADDMGLGKTVQTLAHLQNEIKSGRADRPQLVVAPTSVVPNWRLEAERFVPGMSVLVLHGPDRKALFDEIPHYDLVITSYALLSRDVEEMRKHEYHYVILDEAQRVKNAETKAATAARALEARHRLCLTGTPMENHLGDLWSLFHFLMPGFLGKSDVFRRVFRNPIEKGDDASRKKALAARVKPVLLRRTKEEVASELPPKTEIGHSIELNAGQKALYETVRAAVDKRVRDAIATKGLARSSIIVLDALLKLRQICCHPKLLKQHAVKASSLKSAKLDRLMELLPELLEEGRRVLLFSQFTQMLGLIEIELGKLGIEYVKLTGSTRDRESPVREFQEGKVPLFLISLKAGGVGLNLTAADTVIHYDPWWNPAVENQATDRAHRIGQDKAVFVHRLICAGSIEERIRELQQRKADIAAGILEGRAKGLGLSEDDLRHLLGPIDV